MRNLLILLLIVTFISGILVLAADHQYVGAAKCKMCHSTEYKSWETTKSGKVSILEKLQQMSDDLFYFFKEYNSTRSRDYMDMM